MPRLARAHAPLTRLRLEILEDREVPAFGLDTSFGTSGLIMDALPDTRFNAIVGTASAPGGKLVAAGNLAGTDPFDSGDMAVVRLTPAGAPDPLFGGGDGLADISFDSLHMVAGVATQSDGKVIVVGTAITAGWGTVGSDMFVLRLKADGTLDTSFGTNGEAIIDLNMMDTARRVVIQPDGKILIAGITYPDGDQNNGYSLAMARLTAAGLPDSSFGTAGHVIGEGPVAWSTGGLAIQADGEIVVSGQTTPVFGSSDPAAVTELAAVRYNSNGTLDTSFGTGGQAKTNYGSFLYAYASDVVVLSDRRVVVGGGSSYQDGLVAWFSSSGTLLGQEQTGGIGDGLHWVNDLVAKPGGGVWAIGDGFSVEYHAGPGQVSDELAVNPGTWFPMSSSGTVGTDGKLVVTAPVGMGFSNPTGYGLGVVRFGDPGITHSPTTFVQSLTLTDPAPGPLVLAAAVIPLLGNGPLTEGTVVFREGSTVVGTLDLSAATAPGGMYSFSILVTLPAGTHTITADFTGTANWDPSSTSITVNVPKVVTYTTTLSVSNTSPGAGEFIDLTATVTPDDGTSPIWGTVTFFDGDQYLGIGFPDSNGMATYTFSSEATGAHTLRAVYWGPPSSSEAPPVTVTVGKSTSTTSLTSSLAAPVVGQSTTLTAAVATGSGSAAGGTVTFYDGSAVLGTGVVGADGQATLTTALRVGSRTLRAVYSGDNFSLGSTSTPLSLTVGRAVTSTGLTLSTSTAGVGQSVIVTANVGVVLGSAFPVGTVEFREGTKLLGTATVDGRGTAKLTLTNLPTGSHAITANYLGCSTCLGSSSSASSIQIGTLATATNLTTSASAPVFGQTQTLTARVMGAVSGRVNFFDGTTLLGSATVNASGSASLAARLNLGSHKLKAVFAGTASAAGSSSTWVYQTVTRAPTTATLSLGADGITLRVVVQAPFAGSPIGTVTFKRGTIVIGTAQVNGAGVATLRLPSLAAGTYAITAVYSGSSCFLGDISDPLIVKMG